MEVHTHAHSHRKKWTDYFWEFLMLFLAVFCGFLAENIREHKVEHIRAKQFARALVNDFQNDTAAITNHKRTAQNYIAFCDTLVKLSQSTLDGTNAAKFSFYTRFMYWTAGIRWNRTTFDQIKNSGSLRYFKHGLLEKLMKYDALINDIELEFFNHETRGNTLVNSINNILDPVLHQQHSKLFLVSVDTMSPKTLESYLSVKANSLEPVRDEIKKLLNMIVIQQRNLRFGENRLVETKQMAEELISDFRDEYHLK